MNWERWESLGAAFIAAAEILTPLVRTEPIILPLAAEAQIQQVGPSAKIHDNPAAKLSMLYRENLLETARTNTVTDTVQSVIYKGNTPISDRPRRRQYYTDKFVFIWPEPPTA